MPIDIKMPALSPTMEQGTLSKWLVKEGDTVASGDLLAEIETDKATMEFEAVDEGTILSLAIPAGTEGVKVGTVIATMATEGEDASAPPPAAKAEPTKDKGDKPVPSDAAKSPAVETAPPPAPAAKSATITAVSMSTEGRILASPLAKRIAAEKGVDLSSLSGTGPHGRIVKADVEGAKPGTVAPKAAAAALAPAATATTATAAASAVSTKLTDAIPDFGIPFEDQKLSGMRKTIARRLTESKQQVPHIYLTVDVRLDALLKLRAELNDAISARGVKLSVNDMLIKALGLALVQVPKCNVAFAGDVLRQYQRADVSVAVSVPNGLITPIVTDAGSKSLAHISGEMSALGQRAKEGKLQPSEYQGGTASLSNMGMMGIRQFDAVINPPQGMIMAIGAGEKRPWVMGDGTLGVATAMCATGSFDHRAIDGADGAQLMTAFRDFVEKPLSLVA